LVEHKPICALVALGKGGDVETLLVQGLLVGTVVGVGASMVWEQLAKRRDELG